MRERDEMGHDLETWDIVHSLIISSRDLACVYYQKRKWREGSITGFLIYARSLISRVQLDSAWVGSLLLFQHNDIAVSQQNTRSSQYCTLSNCAQASVCEDYFTFHPSSHCTVTSSP